MDCLIQISRIQKFVENELFEQQTDTVKSLWVVITRIASDAISLKSWQCKRTNLWSDYLNETTPLAFSVTGRLFFYPTMSFS